MSLRNRQVKVSFEAESTTRTESQVQNRLARPRGDRPVWRDRMVFTANNYRNDDLTDNTTTYAFTDEIDDSPAVDVCRYSPRSVPDRTGHTRSPAAAPVLLRLQAVGRPREQLVVLYGRARRGLSDVPEYRAGCAKAARLRHADQSDPRSHKSQVRTRRIEKQTA